MSASSAGGDPPNRDINHYKCCPSKQGPSSAVCYRCGGAWHPSCITRDHADKVLYLKNYLVECCKDNITYNDDHEAQREIDKCKSKIEKYREESELVIEKYNSLVQAHHKLKDKYQILKVNNEKLVNEMSEKCQLIEEMKALEEEVLLLKSQLEQSKNKEVNGDDMQVNIHDKLLELNSKCTERELVNKDLTNQVNLLNKLNQSLNDNNILSKKLIDKMNENNLLLNEKIENLKNNTQMNSRYGQSYADISKTSKTRKTNTQVPKIKISSSSDLDPEANIMNVRKILQSQCKAPINAVLRRKDTILVACDRMDDIAHTEKLLADNLDSKISVEIENLKNPVVRVVDVDTDMNTEELEADIKARNLFSNPDEICKVIYIKESKLNNSKTLYIEISSTIHARLVSNNYFVHVGHQNCKAFDHININICYKCGRLNHTEKKCDKNDYSCLICNGNHAIRHCKVSDIIECANCDYNNRNFNSNLNTNHLPSDTRNCELLKARIRRFIHATDYISTPRIPKHIDNLKRLILKEKAGGHDTTMNDSSTNSRTYVNTKLTTNGKTKFNLNDR